LSGFPDAVDLAHLGIGPDGHTSLTAGLDVRLSTTVRVGGSVVLPPQAGVAVYERGLSGRLAAAHVYDDVKAPVE
jgi:hypothetical protein